MPAAAVAIPAVISAGSSIGQMVSGKKMAKKAKEEIDNYQRQDLMNPYEGLQVSTLGADRQREDLARSIATYANMAAMGGTRGILGLAPQMLSQQNQQNAQIAAGLDEQEKQRQQLIARGNEMVQNMTEVREQQDLAGLGQMWQTGRAESMNGINNLVKTGISTAGAFADMYGDGGGSGGSNKSNVNTGGAQLPTQSPGGIFASQPTNLVGDILRGAQPSGLTTFEMPNMNTGMGKTGNFSPQNNFGLYGQTGSYYNTLMPFRFNASF